MDWICSLAATARYCRAGAVTFCVGIAQVALPMGQAHAQTAPPPGSTINGTVPTSEGNIWNGLDHQPTPADVPSIGSAQQAQISHKLDNLDQQLLNYKLPKLPAGAPPVAGN
jgi:hypothetical protein